MVEKLPTRLPSTIRYGDDDSPGHRPDRHAGARSALPCDPAARARASTATTPAATTTTTRCELRSKRGGSPGASTPTATASMGRTRSRQGDDANPGARGQASGIPAAIDTVGRWGRYVLVAAGTAATTRDSRAASRSAADRNLVAAERVAEGSQRQSGRPGRRRNGVWSLRFAPMAYRARPRGIRASTAPRSRSASNGHRHLEPLGLREAGRDGRFAYEAKTRNDALHRERG
jgi:hypothetical protein